MLRLLATGSFYITMGDFIGVSTVNAHRIMSRANKGNRKFTPTLYKISFNNSRNSARTRTQLLAFQKSLAA